MRKNKILLPWFLETRLASWKKAIEEAHMYMLDGIDICLLRNGLGQILWGRIWKFYEILFCTYCKGLFCLQKTVIMVIFLCICIKHSQHEEMRKNNSKLNFTKNHLASWFSRGQLKTSKCLISLARLGECSKSKDCWK